MKPTAQEVIAELIGTLTMLTLLTATKIDDMALRFVIAVQHMPWFVAIVERILPADTPEEVEAQSLVYEPELVEHLRVFAKAQPQGMFGSYGQILSLVLQIIAIIKARKAAAPTPTT